MAGGALPISARLFPELETRFISVDSRVVFAWEMNRMGACVLVCLRGKVEIKKELIMRRCTWTDREKGC